jgi:hypothetical protein
MGLAVHGLGWPLAGYVLSMVSPRSEMSMGLSWNGLGSPWAVLLMGWSCSGHALPSLVKKLNRLSWPWVVHGSCLPWDRLYTVWTLDELGLTWAVRGLALGLAVHGLVMDVAAHGLSMNWREHGLATGWAEHGLD